MNMQDGLINEIINEIEKNDDIVDRWSIYCDFQRNVDEKQLWEFLEIVIQMDKWDLEFHKMMLLEFPVNFECKGIDYLLEFYFKTNKIQLKSAIIHASRRCYNKKIENLLVKELENESSLIRQDSAIILGNFGANDAHKYLLNAFEKEGDRRTKYVMAENLLFIEGLTGQGNKYLKEESDKPFGGMKPFEKIMYNEYLELLGGLRNSIVYGSTYERKLNEYSDKYKKELLSKIEKELEKKHIRLTWNGILLQVLGYNTPDKILTKEELTAKGILINLRDLHVLKSQLNTEKLLYKYRIILILNELFIKLGVGYFILDQLYQQENNLSLRALVSFAIVKGTFRNNSDLNLLSEKEIEDRKIFFSKKLNKEIKEALENEDNPILIFHLARILIESGFNYEEGLRYIVKLDNEGLLDKEQEEYKVEVVLKNNTHRNETLLDELYEFQNEQYEKLYHDSQMEINSDNIKQLDIYRMSRKELITEINKRTKIGIVTAIEEEDLAIKNYFITRQITDSQNISCNVGFLKSSEEIFGIIHYAGKKGLGISPYVPKLINNWNPDYIFYISIAAGIYSKGVMIGDLVIPEVTCNTIQKSLGISQPDLKNVHPILFNILRDFTRSENKYKWYTTKKEIRFNSDQLEVIRSNIQNQTSFNGKPVIHCDNDLIILCTKEVVSGPENVNNLIIENITEGRRRYCRAIDMESFDVLTSAQLDNIMIGIITAISDLPDIKNHEEMFKKFNLHNLAANRAAKFLHDFLVFFNQ